MELTAVLNSIHASSMPTSWQKALANTGVELSIQHVPERSPRAASRADLRETEVAARLDRFEQKVDEVMSRVLSELEARIRESVMGQVDCAGKLDDMCHGHLELSRRLSDIDARVRVRSRFMLRPRARRVPGLPGPVAA